VWTNYIIDTISITDKLVVHPQTNYEPYISRKGPVNSFVITQLITIPDVDDCTPNTCLNGGTCTDGINSYTCDCSGTRHAGTNCEICTCPGHMHYHGIAHCYNIVME